MKRTAIASLINNSSPESSFSLDQPDVSHSTQKCETCSVVLHKHDIRWQCHGCKTTNCWRCNQSVSYANNGHIFRLCSKCYKRGLRIVDSGENVGMLIDLSLKLSFGLHQGKLLESMLFGDPKEQRFVKVLARQSFGNIEYQSKKTNKGSNFRKQVEIARYLINKQNRKPNYNLRRHRKQPTKYGDWTK